MYTCMHMHAYLDGHGHTGAPSNPQRTQSCRGSSIQLGGGVIGRHTAENGANVGVGRRPDLGRVADKDLARAGRDGLGAVGDAEAAVLVEISDHNRNLAVKGAQVGLVKDDAVVEGWIETLQTLDARGQVERLEDERVYGLLKTEQPSFILPKQPARAPDMHDLWVERKEGSAKG